MVTGGLIDGSAWFTDFCAVAMVFVAFGVLAAILLASLIAAGVYVAVSYSAWLLEHRHNGSIPKKASKEQRAQFFRTVMGELLSAWMFILVHPLGLIDPFPVRRCARQAKKGERPLLLVHGYSQTWSNFLLLRPRLRSTGRRLIYTVNLKPKGAGIAVQAARISELLSEILQATGASEIDVVAHSMGGLAVRCAEACSELKNGSSTSRRRVRRLVTLGTPHRGSRFALFGTDPSMEDMQEGSTFLETLPPPPPGMIVAISSQHDNVVFPAENAQIGAPGRDVVIQKVGHLSLLTDSRVCEEVVLALSEDIMARSQIVTPLREVEHRGSRSVA